MDGLAQLLRLPDQEEQADIQHQTPEPEGSQSLPYNGLICSKTVGMEPVARKQRCRGSHEADIRPAETGHLMSGLPSVRMPGLPFAESDT